MAKVLEVYRPSAVVLQCGADSLAGDRLGCFNLSLKGSVQCYMYVYILNTFMDSKSCYCVFLLGRRSLGGIW